MNTQNTSFNPDAQSDSVDLDSLEDLLLSDLDEGSGVLPAGAYEGTIKLKPAKSKKGDLLIFAELTVTSVLELADTSAKEPKIGAETSIMFNMGNKYGQRDFNALAKGLGSGANASLADVIRDAVGKQIRFVSVVRPNKEDASSPYQGMTGVSLL